MIKPARLGYLDALRGIAILGVLLVHMGQAVQGLPEWFTNGASFGARGVQLFYIVSAYTMLTISRNGLNEQSFFIRRFFRIAPLFYLSIVVYLLFYGLGPREYAPHGIGWVQILSAFTFLHGWRPDTVNAIVPGGWSVACECMFYLAFPLLRKAITSLPRAVGAFVLSLILAAATMYGLRRVIPGPSYLVGSFLFFSIFAQSPAFMAGFIWYFLPTRWIEKYSNVIANLTLISIVGLALTWKTFNYYWLAIPPLTLFAWAMSAKPTLFNNPITRNLGLISFSLYLSHHLVIDPLAAILHPHGLVGWLAIFTCSFAGSVALSTVTYRWIEKPMIALGHRLSARFLAGTVTPAGA
jgi:exopolysaccharide production protein ExoZ